MPDTHVVTNQVPDLEDYNPATSPVLVEALIREGGQWGLEEVNEVGVISASREALRWGELADRNRPILHTHDRYGHRLDEVEYDPAYHQLMRTAISNGMHAAPWADERPGAHVVRAAKTSVWTVEPGHVCHHETRHHRWHVDDREAGRVRCARRHYRGEAERRRHVQPDRSQVVHLGADV